MKSRISIAPGLTKARAAVPWRALSCVAVLVLNLAIDTVAGELSFQRVEVDANPPRNPWYKILGDIDGDGRLDIIVGGQDGPLVWYAYPNWMKRQIAARGWAGVKGEAADLDGDGDTDIVMGGVVWFRNPRIGGGDWTMLRIDSQKAHDVEVADLDLDGKADVVGRDQSAFGGAGNAIHVYRQVDRATWAKRTLACPHGEGLKLGDIDRDGDPDIIIGGRWYENDAHPVNGAWTEHIYTTADFDPDSKVALADLNGDGRLDIVLAPAELAGQTNKIAWYQAPPDPKSRDWAEHIIVPHVETVIHGLAAADFDHDGHVDLAYSRMHQGADPDEVCVMRNLERGRSWRKLVLSTNGSHDLVVGDIDGDGAPDIVGANWSGPRQPIEWWRNTSFRSKGR